jgi:HSP20 family protein
MAEATAVKRAEEPVKPVKQTSLLDQIDETFNTLSRRAYDIFESKGRAFGQELDNWFQAERELLHPLHIHVTESDGTINVKADVPGFSEKELEIGVEPRRVTITGKRETKKEEKKGKAVYSESCSDQILRVVDLPADVETDKVTATVKNGVLELALPKSPKTQTRRIHPNAA